MKKFEKIAKQIDGMCIVNCFSGGEWEAEIFSNSCNLPISISVEGNSMEEAMLGAIEKFKTLKAGRITRGTWKTRFDK